MELDAMCCRAVSPAPRRNTSLLPNVLVAGARAGDSAVLPWMRRLAGWVAGLLLAAPPAAQADIIHTNETINSPTTWTAASNDHIIVGTLTISSTGSLTINDGCVLRFDHTALLSCSGTLNANGGASGILFTRRDPTDEWWGVRFNSGSIGSLQRCTIEYSTHSTSYGIHANSAASLSVQNCTVRNCHYGIHATGFSPTISGCTIQNNASDGIYATGAMPAVSGCTIENNVVGLHVLNASPANLTVANTIRNNTTGGVMFTNCGTPTVSNQSMTGNSGVQGAIFMDDTGEFQIGAGNAVTGNSWGLSISSGSAPSLASMPNLPVAGNTNADGIQVRGGTSTKSVTWRDLNKDFIVTQPTTVSAGGSLTIQDGVTVKFEHTEYLANSGTLNATGGASGIFFTRRDPTDEWWGIRYNSGSSGTLQGCTIEYSTHSTSYGIYGNSAASLSVQNCTVRNCHFGIHATGFSPTISGCIIQNNASDGIYATGAMPAVSGCTIENNVVGLHVLNASPANLTVANTIRNNTTAGVMFTNCGTPTVSNQSMTGNSGVQGAIFMDDTGEFQIGAGNAVTGNSWGLSISSGSAPSLASMPNLPVAGNTNADGIQVRGGTSTKSVTWRDLNKDFVVTQPTTVSAGGSLTIQDGVTVKFEHTEYLANSGTLNATGGASGIFFTRRDPTDEWWGIRYNSGSSGTLQGCTIEYSTHSTSYGIYGNSAASLSVQNSTVRNCHFGIHTTGFSPTISGCIIQNNASDGIYATGAMPAVSGCTIENNVVGLHVLNASPANLTVANTIRNNTTAGVMFTNCGTPTVSNQSMTGNSGVQGAIFMDDTGEFQIGAGNAVTGNSWGLSISSGSAPSLASMANLPVAGNTNADGIQVRGGTSTKSVTWRDLNKDFIVTQPTTVSAGGSLTIQDGVTVKFEHTEYLANSGTLNATGGASGIFFTRRDPTDEWWGIRYNSGSSGTLQGCTIEYSTYSSSYGVFANSATSLSLSNCTIRNCDTGVHATNTSPSFINCSITNNAQYGINLSGTSAPTFGSNLSQWNDVYGNGSGNPNRDLQNGTQDVVAAYVYWGVLDVPGIQGRIHHEPDDASEGLVIFTPWTNAAHNVAYGGTTDAAVLASLPTEFSLFPNRPNPVRSDTALRYALPHDARVQLDVFDVAGRRVATLVEGFEKAGLKEVWWNARTVASGTYFVHFRAGDVVQTRKLVVLK